MYYNSNKQANDYYNSYKREMQELQAYEKQGKIQQLMKILFFFIVLFLLGLASYYLYRYFNPKIQNTHQVVSSTHKKQSQLPTIIISEEELPLSPQLRAYQKEQMEHIQENATDTTKLPKSGKNIHTTAEKTTNISQKDIALIVKIIMAQMNTQKEPSLETQLTAVESTKFTPKQLKESNHYNKIILNDHQLNTDETIQNKALVELTNDMNSILEEPVEDKVATNYSTAIKKEVAYRENEMRIIVVKKGDTLSRIAKRAYGNYNDYPKIFSANPEIIKNPNQIFEGMRLRIPA